MWATGGLGSTAFKHFAAASREFQPVYTHIHASMCTRSLSVHAYTCKYVHMQSKCNMHMHASMCTHSLSAHAMQTYSQNECTGTCISCSRWCTESACLLYLAMEAPVHLGRSPADECSTQLNCPDCPPFTEKVMDVSGGNATFIVNIGPTGSERGYMAIAGRLSACGCFVFPPF